MLEITFKKDGIVQMNKLSKTLGEWVNQNLIYGIMTPFVDVGEEYEIKLSEVIRIEQVES